MLHEIDPWPAPPLSSSLDDRSVVVEVEKGVGSMERNRVPLALRDRLGEPGTAGLLEFTEDRHATWRDEVLSVAAERFDRRLTEEVSKLRVDVAEAIAGVRQEIASGR